MVNIPKYTTSKMKGNIGEAFVQYVLSDFCLVHKIDGSNDVGNDMICELIKDQYPTNLLFYVQVKYTKDEPKIKPSTRAYWKNSPIPVYVFWVQDAEPVGSKQVPQGSFKGLENRTEYKRFTPIVHGTVKESKERYKKFIRQDFLFDLLDDYTRCQYIKGFMPVLQPRDFLALDEKRAMSLPRHILEVKKLTPKYRKSILKNSWSNLFGIAASLYEESPEKGSRAKLKLALALLQSAKKLINKKQVDESNSRENMAEYEQKIRNRLGMN